MRYLALALLLLAGCESAKIKPWIAFTDYDGSRIGVNDAGSSLVNTPVGSAMEIGIGFEFPLGPSAPRRVLVDWPDLPPRYDLAMIPNSPKVSPPSDRDTKVPDETAEERALRLARAAEDFSWSGIGKFAAVGLIIAMLGWMGVKGYKVVKNGRGDE